MFICRLLIKQSGMWLGLMAFHILAERRLYTMFRYLGCCSRRCPSDPMYPWPTSEFTGRQSRWSSCLWMASHFRNPQLSASLPKIFFPAREFAQQHREGRRSNTLGKTVSESTSWPLSLDNSGGMFHMVSQRIPNGMEPQLPKNVLMNETLLDPFPLVSPLLLQCDSWGPFPQINCLIGSLSWGLLSRKPKLRLMPWRQLKTSNRCFYIYLFVLHLTLQRICGDLELNTLNKIMNS